MEIILQVVWIQMIMDGKLLMIYWSETGMLETRPDSLSNDDDEKDETHINIMNQDEEDSSR